MAYGFSTENGCDELLHRSQSRIMRGHDGGSVVASRQLHTNTRGTANGTRLTPPVHMIIRRNEQCRGSERLPAMFAPRKGRSVDKRFDAGAWRSSRRDCPIEAGCGVFRSTDQGE